MVYKINIASFIATMVCIVLFTFSCTSKAFVDFVTSLSGIHPLNIVLAISLINFIFGVVGFVGIHNWLSMLRSLTTVILTLAMSAVIIYILVTANFFQFT